MAPRRSAWVTTRSSANSSNTASNRWGAKRADSVLRTAAALDWCFFLCRGQPASTSSSSSTALSSPPPLFPDLVLPKKKSARLLVVVLRSSVPMVVDNMAPKHAPARGRHARHASVMRLRTRNPARARRRRRRSPRPVRTNGEYAFRRRRRNSRRRLRRRGGRRIERQLLTLTCRGRRCSISFSFSLVHVPTSYLDGLSSDSTERRKWALSCCCCVGQSRLAGGCGSDLPRPALSPFLLVDFSMVQQVAGQCEMSRIVSWGRPARLIAPGESHISHSPIASLLEKFVTAWFAHQRSLDRSPVSQKRSVFPYKPPPCCRPCPSRQFVPQAGIGRMVGRPERR